MSNFSEILVAGLNNPDCSFWVGTFIGQITTVKLIFVLGGLMLLYKLIDKMFNYIVIEPILTKFTNYVNKKVKRKRK